MRVTADEVKAVIDTSLTDAQIEAYIGSANVMVTDLITGLSDDVTKEIERWLTAHMIASTRERVAKEEGAGGAYIKYTGEYGRHLNSTQYGQMVIALDTTGAFASAGMKRVVIKAIEQDI